MTLSCYGRKMNFMWKAADGIQSPTPLPNKKLLFSIPDRLQKNFKKPVNPKELPDYHDTIEHPMDFKTIRKKLDNGEYASLEQFEAQAIKELAEKEFKNLRGDDNGGNESQMAQEPSGNSNNTIKRKAMAVDSSANIAGNGRRLASLRPNMGWKGKDKLSAADAQRSASSDGTREDESISSDELGTETSEDDSGPRYCKVAISRRRSYEKDKHRSTNCELPMSAFDIGTRKQLAVPLLQPLDYARSLARFAANLGSAGWDVAASRIQRALPPGTAFGRGWVTAAVPRPEPPRPRPPPSLAAAASGAPSVANAGATAAMEVQM